LIECGLLTLAEVDSNNKLNAATGDFEARPIALPCDRTGFLLGGRMSSFAINSQEWLSSGRIQLLSTEAEGCYLRLLSFCWILGSLPVDLGELSKLCHRGSPEAILAASALFQIRDGRLISEELDRQRRRAHRVQKTKLSDFRPILETHSYRAQRAGVEDSLTLDQWGVLLESTAWRCAWCRSDQNIQVEHMIPISRGGGNTVDNVAPFCSSCNFSKGNKTALEWIWRK